MKTKKDETDYYIQISKILERYSKSQLIFLDKQGENHRHEMIYEIINLLALK